MPVFLEYDKTNGEITRVLSAPEPPKESMHLEYQVVPEGAEEVPVSGDINEARKIIADHLDNNENIGHKGKVTISEVPPPFEKVR